MQPMLNIAVRAARQAGELIVRAGEELDRVPVETKSANDYVTEVDRNAEETIVRALRKAYPDHAIRGEEGGYREGGPDAEYEWVIDPLDGTTNFVRGIPHYCVSIACKRRGRLEHGVVFDPFRREEFTASRGSGAQLNGRRIRVSGRQGLDGALLGTGFPFKGHALEQMEPYLGCVRELAGVTAGIRRAGAAALDLVYVAAGRFDAFWEMYLQEWDIAAGALIVQEAGGLVSDFQGGNDHLQSGHVLAGSPKVFKAVLPIVQRHLGQVQMGQVQNS